MTHDERIKFLQEAFMRGENVEAVHVESVPVKDTFQGQTVWEGIVDVFDIKAHPYVKRGYGWSYTDESGDVLYKTVMGIRPIKNAVDAVRAAILQDARLGR